MLEFYGFRRTAKTVQTLVQTKLFDSNVSSRLCHGRFQRVYQHTPSKPYKYLGDRQCHVLDIILCSNREYQAYVILTDG